MKLARVVAISAIASVFAVSNASFVMDQIGTNPADFDGANIISSQEFEAANAAFNIAAIDDFTLSESTTLTSVDFAGGIFNNAAGTWDNVGDFTVDIYSDISAGANSLAGDVYSTTVAHSSATINTGYFTATQTALVSLPIDVVLGPGTYWIGVRPNNDFSANGQTGVMTSGFAGGSPNNANAVQVNPGGGFGFTNNQQVIDPAANLGYRISGEPVPEPATMTVLGLGALAMLRRRRNKKA